MLTFELTNEEDELEVHFDEEGARQLVQAIQIALSSGDHQHLMTPAWGGAELTEEKLMNNPKGV